MQKLETVKVSVFPDYNILSENVASQVIELVKNQPDAMFCLASGDSPKLACKLIAETAIKENIDFSKARFAGLDEWLGIPPENEGSCHFFFKNLMLEPLQLSPSQFHLFDALSADPQHECKKMDEFIFKKGRLDLVIVGIGMNGHIGFNEPGISFDKYSHIANLDSTTTSVGQKYFSGPMNLSQGITLGFNHLMQAKKLILMANGVRKASVVRKAVEGEVTNKFPASIIQQHANAVVMVDEDAASLLKGSR